MKTAWTRTSLKCIFFLLRHMPPFLLSFPSSLHILRVSVLCLFYHHIEKAIRAAGGKKLLKWLCNFFSLLIIFFSTKRMKKVFYFLTSHASIMYQIRREMESMLLKFFPHHKLSSDWCELMAFSSPLSDDEVFWSGKLIDKVMESALCYFIVL
jgi:hypothetical protein